MIINLLEIFRHSKYSTVRRVRAYTVKAIVQWTFLTVFISQISRVTMQSFLESISTQDLESLEKLIIESRDFQKLESKVSTFNLFEAMGAVRQELRHSHFIAFLLDPSGSHGLGDVFLRKFLQESLKIARLKNENQIITGFRYPHLLNSNWHLLMMLISGVNGETLTSLSIYPHLKVTEEQ